MTKPPESIFSLKYSNPDLNAGIHKKYNKSRIGNLSINAAGSKCPMLAVADFPAEPSENAINMWLTGHIPLKEIF